eukprot:123777_1
MAECKSNQSSTQTSPLFQSVSYTNQISDMIIPSNTPTNNLSNLNNTTFYDTNDYISRDFNTGRLSKVTEENSNNNNSTKSTEEEELSPTNNNNNNTQTHMSVSINNNPIQNNIRYYTQTINRHNNTPHTNDDEPTTTPSYNQFTINNPTTPSYINDQPHEFIPERIRILLDRFAANGYIISNAPPPANNKIIETIPEIIVDKKLIDNNDAECS